MHSLDEVHIMTSSCHTVSTLHLWNYSKRAHNKWCYVWSTFTQI